MPRYASSRLSRRWRLTPHCSGLGVSRCAPSFSPLNSISLGSGSAERCHQAQRIQASDRALGAVHLRFPSVCSHCQLPPRAPARPQSLPRSGSTALLRDIDDTGGCKVPAGQALKVSSVGYRQPVETQRHVRGSVRSAAALRLAAASPALLYHYLGARQWSCSNQTRHLERVLILPDGRCALHIGAAA